MAAGASAGAGGGGPGRAGGLDAGGTGGGWRSAAARRRRTYADLLRYGLPVAGGLSSSIIQANASGKASDAQQKYLEEALAYEKESDLYKRGVDAAAVAKEAARYGDYQGRIGAVHRQRDQQ